MGPRSIHVCPLARSLAQHILLVFFSLSSITTGPTCVHNAMTLARGGDEVSGLRVVAPRVRPEKYKSPRLDSSWVPTGVKTASIQTSFVSHTVSQPTYSIIITATTTTTPRHVDSAKPWKPTNHTIIDKDQVLTLETRPSQRTKMQIASKLILALALLGSAVLSAALPAPEPQLLPSGDKGDPPADRRFVTATA